MTNTTKDNDDLLDTNIDLDLDVENEIPERTHVLHYMEVTPEEYYNQPDCAYIRLQYIPEGEGIKFQVRNEMFYAHTPETLPEGMVKLATFLRGMLETALVYPYNVYQMGQEAQQLDMIDQQTTDMAKDQRDLLKGEPMGNA